MAGDECLCEPMSQTSQRRDSCRCGCGPALDVFKRVTSLQFVQQPTTPAAQGSQLAHSFPTRCSRRWLARMPNQCRCGRSRCMKLERHPKRGANRRQSQRCHHLCARCKRVRPPSNQPCAASWKSVSTHTRASAAGRALEGVRRQANVERRAGAAGFADALRAYAGCIQPVG